MALDRRNFLQAFSAGASTIVAPKLFSPRAFNGEAVAQLRGMTPALAPQPLGFDEFMVTARARFRQTAEAEEHIRREALDDLRFYCGEQWPDHIREDRDRAKRPCLTINRLPQIVQQVTNQQRQNRQAAQINPIGDRADKATAEIIQGIIRHTEVNSMADVAWDTAFEYAAIMGFGYWRIRNDYSLADSTSLDQEIYDEWIEDPFSVYLDPSARLYDRSDMGYAFIVSDLTPDRFQHEFPNAHMVGLSDFRSIGDDQRYWYTTGRIRVAEYFWIEEKTVTLVKLVGGQVIEETDLRPGDRIATKDGMPVIREAPVRKVMTTKISALEELEPRTRIPGRYIPIIPVYGRRVIVDGKLQLSGMVRDAKDAQRMYNYNRTKITEAIALAPMAPWLVAEGQIEGYESLYEQANTRPITVLPYRQVDLAGKPAPPPARQVAEPAIQAMAIALAQADNDLKATTGIYDASLGQRGPDESGKAILARQHQGDVANLNLSDNFGRSLRHATMIKLAMVPEVYDTAKVQRIVWPDETHDMVKINQPFVEQGLPKIYDVRVAEYDVCISTGPSYHSRRQEFVSSVLALVQSAPQVMSVVMDLLVKHMDWPGADEIAQRLHAMLPPNLQKPDPDAPPVPPEVQAKIQTLMQQNAMLIQQLQQATNVIEQKKVQAELSKELAVFKGYVDILKATLSSKSAAASELMKQDFAAIKHHIDTMGDIADREADQARLSAELGHESEQAELDRQHQAQQAELDRQHQIQQAAAQPAQGGQPQGSQSYAGSPYHSRVMGPGEQFGGAPPAQPTAPPAA